MALKATDKAKLKTLGIDLDALITAHTAATEVDFPVPDGKVYSDTDIETLTTNIKTQHGGDSPAAKEILGRQLNKDHNLALSNADTKDLTKVIAAMQAKAVKDAGIEPDKKVKELESDIAKLQSKITEKDGEVSTWKTKLSEREEFDGYRSAIDAHNPNKILTPEEHVNRVKKEVKRGEKGEAINPVTGEAYKDNLQNPIKFDDKVKELYTRPNWAEPASATTSKPGMHHSTGSSGGGGAKTGFDAPKTWESIITKYDMTTPKGIEAARAEMTAIQVNTAAKTNV